MERKLFELNTHLIKCEADELNAMRFRCRMQQNVINEKRKMIKSVRSVPAPIARIQRFK